MKISGLILLLLSGACTRVATQPAPAPVASVPVAAPAIWVALVPGPHAVGYARHTSAGGVVHVWYPAIATGTRLTIRDVVAADTARLSGFLTGAKVSDTTVRALLANPLWATAGAPPDSARYPLVLVGQGNGHDAFDQVVLSEYLASHGFVVVTTPSPMLRTPMTREEEVGPMAAEQARELAGAIRTVTAGYRTDTTRIGVVGHSFGARAALLLAMNDPRVRAMVSLDGGIGTATATASFTRVPAYKPGASLPPLLHFYEELDEFMKPDFSLLGSLRFEQLSTIRHSAMRHAHFTTYGLAVGQYQELATLTRATGLTAQETADVYRLTKDFLLKMRK